MDTKFFFQQPKFWQTKNIYAILLLPFSLIFKLTVKIRFFLYRKNIFKFTKFKIPVIVVGNISVGGTGKTPLVIWLANFLFENGFKPGIVSRGFSDEAILIHRRVKLYNIPLFANVDRALAVERLLQANHDCNVIISDDGLQHYALARDVEIIVVDGERGFGNGLCLPAGPLREPISRISKADFIVINGENKENKIPVDNKLYQMNLMPTKFINVFDHDKVLALDDKYFIDKKIHAVAGIGNPQRFFSALEKLNLKFIAHAFSDHYIYIPEDLNFGADTIIIMTEKDAVKCEGKNFSNQNFWFLSIDAKLDENFGKNILEVLPGIINY